MKWTNKGHQFDEIAKEILSYDGDYYIWGTGEKGEFNYSFLKDEINIRGFIDSNESVKNYNELKVYHISELKLIKGKIIIAINDYNNYTKVRELLIENGLIESKDFFGKEFTSVYYLYKLDKLIIDSFDLSITTRCTLNCKYCCNFMPYIKNQIDLSLDDSKNILDNIFDNVHHVNKVNLVGGEVFINKHFTDIVEYLCLNYNKKISKIIIATNGTILPNLKQIELFSKYNIHIVISDYRNGSRYAEKLEEFVKVIKENDISLEYYTLDKWVDFGFPHNIPSQVDESLLLERFDLCNTHCRVLVDKKYYSCQFAMNANRTGKFKEKSTDYFILNDNYNKKEFLEYTLGYSTDGYVSFCKFCRGYQSDIKVDASEMIK